jgi:hypothetical protein
MMRISKGGTGMWCSYCEAVTTCKAIPAAHVTGKSEDYQQVRNYEGGHADIQFFLRGRECLTCTHVFVTAEVDEAFLGELVELRKALSAIKQNAEAYITESAAASCSLNNLAQSLNVLRALSIYRDVHIGAMEKPISP